MTIIMKPPDHHFMFFKKLLLFLQHSIVLYPFSIIIVIVKRRFMSDDKICILFCSLFNYGYGWEHGRNNAGYHLTRLPIFNGIYRFAERRQSSFLQNQVNYFL